jgi:hypothetical protein
MNTKCSVKITMSGWILLLIALVLLAIRLVRERFEATPSIQAPPYNDDAKRSIFEKARTANQRILIARVQSLPSPPTETAKLEAAAGGLLAPTVAAFFTEVFKPAVVPITKDDVVAFLATRPSDLQSIEEDVLVQYFVNQQGLGSTAYNASLAAMGQGPGYLVGGEDDPVPVCPIGTVLRTEDGKCVGSGSAPAPTCRSGYTMNSAGRCQRTGGSEVIDATECASGFEYNGDTRACDTLPVEPTCPGGFTFREGQCRAGASTSGTATTTGGSSTSTRGPTTGGPTSRIRQVFGPQFAGSGSEVGRSGGDSSQLNVYPELLGGLMDTSTRIPGAGITSPSKSWTLATNGSLPPTTAMGSDEMSRYFPFSRSPGDMDVIADPYRVAQSFSSSSYSSKTEPVPFLTDFSAFQS